MANKKLAFKCENQLIIRNISSFYFIHRGLLKAHRQFNIKTAPSQ